MLTVKEKLIRQLMFVLAILAVALWPASGFSGTNILNIRHWAAPDHTRIVIDTSEEA